MTDKITHGSIEMTWDSETRLAVLRFLKETTATSRDAEVLIEALLSWIGKEGKSFSLLGDGANLAEVEPGYREKWAKFFKEHRKDSLIAFFNMNPFIRIAAELFRVGTGIQLKAFEKESNARSWLSAKH